MPQRDTSALLSPEQSRHLALIAATLERGASGRRRPNRRSHRGQAAQVHDLTSCTLPLQQLRHSARMASRGDGMERVSSDEAGCKRGGSWVSSSSMLYPYGEPRRTAEMGSHGLIERRVEVGGWELQGRRSRPQV